MHTTIRIRSSIPKAWKELIRKFDNKHINISSEDDVIIHFVIKENAIDKITCADFYLYLIETKQHKPNNINKWCEVFQDCESANKKSWHRIFKLPFVILRNSKILTFQYKVLNRVIPYNKCLYYIKINECCNEVDDIVHFFLKCSKIHVINYCIFYIKYYIYIQKLFNKNHLDVHSCQMQLKHLEIECEICN